MAKEKAMNVNENPENEVQKGKAKAWLKDHVVGVVVGFVGVLTLAAAVVIAGRCKGQDAETLEGSESGDIGIQEIPECGIPEI